MIKFESLEPFATGPYLVLGLRRILPAGKHKTDDGTYITRPKTLVQVYTDPGGMRTLAAASIRFNDPGRSGELRVVR